MTSIIAATCRSSHTGDYKIIISGLIKASVIECAHMHFDYQCVLFCFSVVCVYAGHIDMLCYITMMRTQLPGIKKVLNYCFTLFYKSKNRSDFTK